MAFATSMASEQVPIGAMRPKNSIVKLQVSRTTLCKFHAVKQCRYGNQCNFAHGPEKLEQVPDFRKTSICKDWRQGTCQLQSIDCPFAHGRSDLRRTEVYMHRANGSQDDYLFDDTKPATNGSRNRNLFGKTNMKSNGSEEHNLYGNTNPDHNLYYNTKLEVDHSEEYGVFSTSSGDEPIDVEPVKVGTMDSLNSISLRSSSTISTNIEPARHAMPPSLEYYGGPSVMLCNLPFNYSKKMLTSEIEDLGFDIPGDIAYIHLPTAFNTQLNYGHCLVIFNGSEALNEFMDVFQGRVLRQFRSEEKTIMGPHRSSHGPGVEANLFTDMEVTRLSEVALDSLIWGQPAECTPCTGCGLVNNVVGHRFCPWCGQQPASSKHHTDLRRTV